MPHIGEKSEIISQRGAAQNVTPTGSAFSYGAPSNGIIILSGGTVSSIEYGRGASFYTIGLVTGSFYVSRGDTIRVTYVVAPTMTFLPN